MVLSLMYFPEFLCSGLGQKAVLSHTELFVKEKWGCGMVELAYSACDSIFTCEGFGFGVRCECGYDLVLSFLRRCKDVSACEPSASYRHVRLWLQNHQILPLIVCGIMPEQVCSVGSVDAVD